MITATESPELVAYYRRRINDILSGKITIPETRYERHLIHDEIHASEADGSCLHRAFYNRTLDEIPPLSGNAPLLFLRGRGVERMLITKQPIVVKDGISMEIDDHIEPWGIIEIKSTAADSGYFEPVGKFPHWINRGGIYCVGHGTDCFYLVVYFLVGNLWSSMKRGFRGEKKKVDFRAWKIQFERPAQCFDLNFSDSLDSLSVIWNNAQERRRILIEAIDSGIPPDIDPESWECGSCNFSQVCQHFLNQEKPSYLNERE